MEMINNDDDDHKSKPQNKVEPPATTMIPKPTPDEKRSLFDLDNENSITLADKLRNEANKYYDDGVVKINDDEVVLRRGANSTNDSNAMAERRPSWRLKFDAGSKVGIIDHLYILTRVVHFWDGGFLEWCGVFNLWVCMATLLGGKLEMV